MKKLEKTATNSEIIDAINGLIDQMNTGIDIVNVHEREGDKYQMRTESLELTVDKLREMIADPRYWRDGDPDYIRKVMDGFNKLYGEH